MDIGDAVRAMKDGKRVARQGWNGKDMWLAYSPGNRALPASAFWSEANARYADSQPGQRVEVLPCATMKTADGKIVMGWLASQADLFAEDWFIVG